MLTNTPSFPVPKSPVSKSLLLDDNQEVFEKSFLWGQTGTAETQNLTGITGIAALLFKKLYCLNSDLFPFLLMFPFKCLWPMFFFFSTVGQNPSGLRKLLRYWMAEDIYCSMLTLLEGLCLKTVVTSLRYTLIQKVIDMKETTREHVQICCFAA